MNLLDNAEECYKAVLQLDKNLTKNYINLALLYEQKQQWLDAVNVYEQALNLGKFLANKKKNLEKRKPKQKRIFNDVKKK